LKLLDWTVAWGMKDWAAVPGWQDRRRFSSSRSRIAARAFKPAAFNSARVVNRRSFAVSKPAYGPDRTIVLAVEVLLGEPVVTGWLAGSGEDIGVSFGCHWSGIGIAA
jgi:hypothetical protein